MRALVIGVLRYSCGYNLWTGIRICYQFLYTIMHNLDKQVLWIVHLIRGQHAKLRLQTAGADRTPTFNTSLLMP